MKKPIMILAIVFLGQSTIVNATTDWSPYLKPMLLGCDYPDPTDKLPTHYKASIINKKIKGNENNEFEEILTTYTLKNATTFGYPLAKVEYLQGQEWSHLKLYFKDSKFTALRRQFKLPELNKDPDLIAKVISNSLEGYEVDDGVGSLVLNLDRAEKSISCFWGH